MIELNKISFGYTRKKIIHELSLRVQKGEFFGILGPNGSGKSTILKLISDILKPEKGKVLIEGKDIRKEKRKWVSRQVSAVMQEFYPAYDFSVREIIAMGRTPYLKPLGGETPEDKRIIDKAITDSGLIGFEEKKFHALSGGEKQRVLIAKCFAQNTSILLLDEFVTHLDPGNIQQLMRRVKEKNEKEGITIIAVFHDINLASNYCSRIAVLDEGKIVRIGNPEEILNEKSVHDIYKASCSVIPNPFTGKPQVLFNT